MGRHCHRRHSRSMRWSVLRKAGAVMAVDDDYGSAEVLKVVVAQQVTLLIRSSPPTQ